MISKETIFNTLFEENMRSDPKLLDLNQRILNLENEFKEKFKYITDNYMKSIKIKKYDIY